MRRGKTMMMAVLVAVAGCQTTTESETMQAVIDPCVAQMPQTLVWDGSPPQLPGAGQMYITSLPKNGFVLAAIVDNNVGQVVYARQVPVNKHSSFMMQISCLACRIVTGGNPPPPPDVIDPSLVAAFLVAEGQRYEGVPTAAANDVAVCTPFPKKL